MKGLIKTAAMFSAITLLSTLSFAQNNNNTTNNNSMNHDMNKKWTCETNASSTSDATEKAADEAMEKNAKAAKDAFSFALQHCRDCTKITCSMENG